MNPYNYYWHIAIHDMYVYAPFSINRHHTWSSFEGSAESYNEAVRERRSSSETLKYTKEYFSMCPLKTGGCMESCQSVAVTVEKYVTV